MLVPILVELRPRGQTRLSDGTIDRVWTMKVGNLGA